MKERAIEVLGSRIVSKNTLLCCGLDPDLSRFPHDKSLDNLESEDKVKTFLKQVVDITAEHVCAYKLQKAFFDKLVSGHDILKEIIFYIHKNHYEIPAILDCKIGDIDNTMRAYLDNIFGELQADGVVVNPYMGDDVMRPMVQYPDKAIVVLVKTSNPGGAVVQDVELKNGIPLWRHILQLTIDRWNTVGNMIPVVSSTAKIDLKSIRKTIPDEMLILLAGMGAQGGSCEGLSDLLNSKRSGVFVSSSRGILFAEAKYGQTWQEAVRKATISLKEDLNKERNR